MMKIGHFIFVFIVGLSSILCGVFAGCPSGWTEYRGHCYKAVIANISSNDALLQCQQLKANLASISSVEEDIFVKGLLAKALPGPPYLPFTRFTIGLTLIRNNSTNKIIGLSWGDGTAMSLGNPMISGFTQGNYPWADGSAWGGVVEPKEVAGANCVAMLRNNGSSGDWAAQPCATVFGGYVCEFVGGVEPPVPAPISCPLGYHGFNGNCYMAVYSTNDTVASAQSACSSASGGNLANIFSDAENIFIKGLISKSYPSPVASPSITRYFIGMSLIRDASGAIVGAKFPYYSGNDYIARYGDPSGPGYLQTTSPWADGSGWSGVAEPKGSSYPNATAVAMVVNSLCAGDWAAVPPTTTGGYVCKITKLAYRQTCEMGWNLYKGNCYKALPVLSGPANSTGALTACQAVGATLPSVHDAAENAYLTGLANGAIDSLAYPNAVIWLGAKFNFSGNRHTQSWADGSTVVDAPEDLFEAGEPSGDAGTLTCIDMVAIGTNDSNVPISGAYKNGLWNDHSCESQNSPVLPLCKKPASVCGWGWSYFDGNCYMLNTTGLSTPDAQAFCATLGGNLLSIHSDNENVFVKKLLADWFATSGGSGAYFRIGLQLQYPASGNPPPIAANWTDGTPVDYGNPTILPAGTNPWSNGAWWNNGVPDPEPNNIGGQEYCVWMPQFANVNGEWADQGCTGPYPFICKKPYYSS